MKTLAATAALLLAAVATGAADLVIVQKATGPVAGDTELTMRLSGERARIDVGDQITTIMDLPSGRITSLMHAQKMAMELPGDALKAMKDQMGNPAAVKPDLKPTGKRETINGFACEEYTGRFQNLDIAYWVTNDLPNQKAILEQLGKLSGTGDPLQAALASGADFPGFPIRTIIKGGEAGESTVTVVSIKEEPVPASVFEVPSGYQKMAMPKLPGAGN